MAIKIVKSTKTRDKVINNLVYTGAVVCKCIYALGLWVESDNALRYLGSDVSKK